MELMVRIYKDKPSKIGIKYLQEYLAVKPYEEIFNKNWGDVFSVRMEMVKNKLNLILISDQSGGKIFYKELNYKIESIHKLQNFIKPGMDLEFVHIFNRQNVPLIAKPFRTAKFVKVSHYEIVGPEHFANTL